MAAEGARTPHAVYDLRSDTLTLPTEEMRQAMAAADVGDDVYGEDPTIIRLEQRVAELLGMEAGLFVPSGTMGNVCAILAHTRPGESALIDGESHIAFYEGGGIARLAGVMPRFFPRIGSVPTVQELDDLVPPPDDIHVAPTSFFSLENTHTRAGGVPFAPEETEPVIAWAKERGLAVHIDGARIFNAAIALGRPVTDLVRGADSVMVSLSKGLSAPVGSVLVGSGAFIEKARRARKLMGGGMRQAGVLAAAGLIALERIPLLEEDHKVAAELARRLAALPGVSVREPAVRTNIVIVDLPAREPDAGGVEEREGAALPQGAGRPRPADRLAAALREQGVLVNALAPRVVRLVTHRHVPLAAVDEVVSRFQRALEMAGFAGRAAEHG